MRQLNLWDRTTARTRTKLLATGVVLGLVGVVAGFGTWSAFSSTTENAGNEFVAGTVALGDNDGGSALLQLADAKPGDQDEGCITVSYSGSLAATVKLYGSSTFSSAASLAPHLDLTITRGSFPLAAPLYDSCVGFTADAGVGGGVLYDGKLSDFNTSHTDFTNGLTDANALGTEVWSTDESHVYRVLVKVRDENAAQGRNVTQTFTWEAQNN